MKSYVFFSKPAGKSKCLLYLSALMKFPQNTGMNELMNGPTSMVFVLSDNKVLECYKLRITASEVGSRKFPITCEGSI